MAPRKFFIACFGVLLFASGCAVPWEFGSGDVLHEVSESDLTHELPHGIGGEPWEWVPPTDADVVEVVSLNSGVAAVLTDGVVALDGRTGEVRWTYRALEREVAAGVSPDMSTVLLAVELPEDEETELIGLDAVQGDILSNATIEDTGIDPGFTLPHGWLEFHEGALVARSSGVNGDGATGAGEEMWSFAFFDSCNDGLVREEGRNIHLGEEAVVFPVACAEQDEVTASLVGVDPDSGKVLWEWEEALDGYMYEEFATADFWVREDGDVLAHLSGEGGRVWSVLDTRTGQMTAEIDEDVTSGFTSWDGRLLAADQDRLFYYDQKGSNQTHDVYSSVLVDGSGEEQILVERMAEFSSDTVRPPLNHRDRPLAETFLEEGLLLVGCGTECWVGGTSYPVAAYYSWGSDEPEFEFRLTELDGPLGGRVRQEKVPGAVVVYQVSVTGEVTSSLYGFL